MKTEKKKIVYHSISIRDDVLQDLKRLSKEADVKYSPYLRKLITRAVIHEKKIKEALLLLKETEQE